MTLLNLFYPEEQMSFVHESLVWVTTRHSRFLALVPFWHLKEDGTLLWGSEWCKWEKSNLGI